MNSEQSKLDPMEQTLSAAITHHQAGRLVEAEHLYRTALQADQYQISALYGLAALYIHTGKPKQALPLFETALKLQPQNPAILNGIGAAYQNIGNHQVATTYFQQALNINPQDVSALRNLGMAFCVQGNFESALECFTKIIQLSPNSVDFYLDTGRCCYEMGHFQEAASYFEKALDQKPDYIDALSALGIALWAMGHRDEARTKFERALQIESDNPKLALNLGEFLHDEGKIDEGLHYFNQALTLSPEYKTALWRKSFALLAKGEYREGWTLYAMCLGDRDTRGPNRFAPRKPWDGKPDLNKRLLIWCEQGLGDSLQFIRYAELCKERMNKVSVFCQKPLMRLFKALPFIDDASDVCDIKNFDEHIPVMNLPHIFDTVLETIPDKVPYIKVSPEIETKWAAKFQDTPAALKIGLVWAGGSHKNNAINKITDLQRSISLEYMKPWLTLQGTKFYSLQKDKPAEQIAEFGLRDYLIDFMSEVTDFADTAAIIQNFDLVITVDTSVAHLAGALGKPVWILSRYNADWRWLQNRPTNPWYPTARIFGQPKMGDWASIITKVEHELKREIQKRT